MSIHIRGPVTILAQSLVPGAVVPLLLTVALAWPAAAQPARPAATPPPASSALPPALPPAPPPANALPPPTVSESPDRTTAVFSDWVVRCETRPTTPPVRGCEMAQTTADQRQQPVSVLAVGRQAKGEPLRLVAQVPVNVQTGQAARLVLDIPGRQEPPLTLAFR
ncbi:MAG: hypothetical protein JWP04_3783, partial [Belnapia sp.]|nr:hypothetical protein [Belnapia sp.]